MSLKGYGDNMEIWKDIVGYEGLYQVSNYGSVRSVDRYVPHKIFGRKYCKGYIMATHITSAGYVAVNLCKNNKYKTFDVHRLVAVAFIPNEDLSKTQVNHKDENKTHNSAGNLEWCTGTYNNMYGTKRERQKKKLELPVVQVDSQGNVIKEYSSATAAEVEISGKPTGAVHHCVKGVTKTAYGYSWKYKEAL